MAASVLLVDRDPDSINIYSLILAHHGFEVLSAQDTSTGFQLAVERQPDVMVVELFLPPVEGRTLAQRLREDSRTASVPLILLDSVPVFGDDSVDALAPSCRLTKPCEPSRLVVEVERVLGVQMTLPEM